MPTPLDILLDPITMGIIGIYFLLMLWEAIFPARKLPHIKNWYVKGIISFFVFIFLSTYLPLAYASLLPEAQLLNLTGINPVAGGLIGIFVYEFGMYVWHKAMHKSGWLWKIFHQMHHSAERLDTYGAFFFSPFDMIGFTVLGTVCFSLVLGLPPQSITIMLIVTNFFSVFQHANIRTPVFLGYFVQRPESHAVHHAKGIHAYNYSDLPIFDILFGTFKNPAEYVEETGFYNGASSRIWDMLKAKDVSIPKEDYREEKAVINHFSTPKTEKLKLDKIDI